VTFVDAINENNKVNNNKMVFSAEDRVLTVETTKIVWY